MNNQLDINILSMPDTSSTQYQYRKAFSRISEFLGYSSSITNNVIEHGHDVDRLTYRWINQTANEDITLDNIGDSGYGYTFQYLGGSVYLYTHTASIVIFTSATSYTLRQSGMNSYILPLVVTGWVRI